MSLVALCIAVFVPGFFTLPAVDRDEARFAQASRQMLESGDYVIPRVQGRQRLNKPPLIYWLQATSARVCTLGRPLDDQVWMYRLPSLLAAIAAVLATWRLGSAMFDARTGWLGGAILACCPVMFWEARQARADMVLVACTAWALFFLWRLWQTRTDGPSAWLALGFWTAVGAGVLVKGPITPAVAALTVGSMCIVTRRWRWVSRLHLLPGVALVAMMIGPWLYLVVRSVGLETYTNLMYEETIGRSLAPKEGHSGFPGYHLLLVAALLFPGSMMIGPALVGAVKQARESARAFRGQANADPPGHDAPLLFLLCVIVPAWLVFEVVSTKLPHYTMPIYPALAILCAGAVVDCSAWTLRFIKTPVARIALSGWILCLIVLLVASALAAAYAMQSTALRVVLLSAAGLLAGSLGFTCARQLRQSAMLRLQFLGLAAFVVSAVMLGLAAPAIDQLWISRGLAAQLHTIDPADARPIGTLFHEDSLIFETRGRAERVSLKSPADPTELVDWARAHPDALLVVPSPLGAALPGFHALGAVSGFNYTKGDRVDLVIGEIPP